MVLVEKYPVIAAIWRYLIGVAAAEIRAIPLVTCVDDLPEWVPQPARWLVGFNLNPGSATPKRTLSKQPRGAGWHEERRERVASQLEHIRHWKIIEGDYTLAPDIEATWFVDSVYQKAGRHYLHHSNRIDFAQLSAWCRARRGQPIVCEQLGADWLSFRKLGSFKSGPMNRKSAEVIWP